ncbi:unnamed protein product [Cylindrotheca closterium]|uniref:Uncharacterized protein n=1 Tax=Cylindrotheca closterium TaxID=2856 RepID=A0AAD2GC95_9STRA|nr:unnamed protein product [Cylindrotheca closterium]
MKRRREELKCPSNEELVTLICEPAGEVTNANGKITVQHLCPHPYCNHKSGINLIGRQKGKSYASVINHLKACIGRYDIEDLYNLYTHIKEHPQGRKEILKAFRADVIARMKPNSGEIVEQEHVQQRRKHYELLSASELQDVNSSIEHICMIGVKNRHDERRRKQFKTTHKKLLEKEHSLPLDAPPVNPFGPPQHPDNNLFAEDIRLYGKHETKLFREIPDTASPMEAWPRREKHKLHWKKKDRMFDDKAWDVEHGDTINPIAFTTARLSQKVPSAADQGSMNGSNLLVETTNVGLHETQVPRALLLRCWERAVHASSCMASIPKYDVEATAVPFSAPWGSQTPSSNLDAQSLYNIVQEQAARSKKESREKMKALGMGNNFLKRALLDLTCSVCSRQFDDRAPLESCFFGGVEANGPETGFRGCCWSLIKEKQFSKIKSALETHVQTQVTGALNCIMKQAQERVPDQSGRDEMRLFNWYDVLKFLEGSMTSSQTFTEAKIEKGVTSALETLEVQPKSTPIFLNPAVLESVRNRLVDRYADIPY